MGTFRTRTKCIHRVLLGGVALTVLTSSVKAGQIADSNVSLAEIQEFANLRAQLEALKSRLDTLEQNPGLNSQIPPSASFVTFERGSRMDFVARDPVRESVNQNDEAGFTIAITPAADLPAPVAEIVVYGFVKGDVIYDLDGSENKFSFSMPTQDRFDEEGDEFVFLHAADTRFGIKTKVDTAVGQIRSRIEMDFNAASERDDFGDAFLGLGQQNTLRLRKAYGEWDMTPNWTLLVGQTDMTAQLGIVGVELVDSGGDAGINGGDGRAAQVRLTYHDGPLSWAVAMERPEEASDTLIPNFASYLQYDLPAGHQFMIAGEIADINAGRDDLDLIAPFEVNDNDRKLGWLIGAGGNIILMEDIATFTAGAQYTHGLGDPWMSQLDTTRNTCESALVDDTGALVCEDFGDLQDAWGVTAGLTFNVNDTTSINVEGGYAQNIDAEENELLVVDNVWTVHGNILWQPVKQMRLGWEVMWGRENFVDDKFDLVNGDEVRVCRVFEVDDDGDVDDNCDSSDALRFQFGAWFFF